VKYDTNGQALQNTPKTHAQRTLLHVGFTDADVPERVPARGWRVAAVTTASRSRRVASAPQTVARPFGPGYAVPGLEAAIARGVENLFTLQDAEGYWWSELEANATMAAECLLLEHFLGIGTPERWRKLSNYILARQQVDGSWPVYFGGPGNVSVTVEAYLALKLAGIDAVQDSMTRARQFVLDHGGIENTRVFTRLWLALFGQSDWDAMPAMPPEAMLLPNWSPLNIYEFASWARATIVPILVTWAKRPVVPVPPRAAIEELYVDPSGRARIQFTRDHGLPGWRSAFLVLDRVLRMAEKLPMKPMRKRALKACEAWIVDHQEADGSWGGIQPPWVYSLIALKCLGYSNDHPVMARGIEGIRTGFALETDDELSMRPCVSPVWDTALAIIGLREAGVAADDPRLQEAGRWMVRMEVHGEGDWCVKVRNTPTGGWPFEFANDRYPDTDDTAEVLMALRLLDLGGADGPATQRALTWMRAMQSKGGGFGAFDRDNTKGFVTKIPFADFGATLDPPTEDVTAHVVEAFALFGASNYDNCLTEARRYLVKTQQRDGSWWGRWGVNYVYGTGAAVPALVATGLSTRSRPVRRAVTWLEGRQNGDGGWGESCRSYEDDASRGRGVSTASQTAWALLALLSAGEQHGDSVKRGIAYLVSTQAGNGEWAEDEFTGTGFPRDFMLKYHLYRHCWPLWALGRYRRLIDDTAIHLPGTDSWR
jgi:squalene-hopene/tetraprenyl-beta-curcumene cyclase